MFPPVLTLWTTLWVLFVARISVARRLFTQLKVDRMSVLALIIFTTLYVAQHLVITTSQLQIELAVLELVVKLTGGFRLVQA